MPAPAPITSRSNARVKALRAAFSGRSIQPGDLVGIEGLTLIEEARRSGLVFDSLFARTDAAELLDGEELRSVNASQTLLLHREVFDSVVDTETPQPIAATVRIPADVKWQRNTTVDLTLVLEDIQDPGNVGTLLRSAEAFGVDEIWLTPGCANPWSPKVVRASAGSVFRSKLNRAPISDTLEELRDHKVCCAGAVVQQKDALEAAESNLHFPLALVIGNEGRGLSQAALAGLDLRVHIPCMTESLNAAIAGSILLYEAQRQNSSTGEGLKGGEH